MNYNNKFFRAVDNTPNGETSEQTIFHYQQSDSILTATYQGGSILKGHLIGTVDDNGVIDMRYHQVNINGELRTGECRSMPEVLSDGRLKLHETWQWTSGDLSKGTSIVEEVKDLVKPITEVAILHVNSEMTVQFEKDFEKAEGIISLMDGYINHTLSKCIEVENKYILLVNWKNLESHTIGFRQSSQYQKWKKLLHHYYDPFPVVEHYTTLHP